MRVTFQHGDEPKLVFSIRSRVVDVVNDAEKRAPRDSRDVNLRRLRPRAALPSPARLDTFALVTSTTDATMIALPMTM